MHKIIKLLLVCSCTIILFGCKTETEDKTYKIGIIVYDSYDTFITSIMTEFQKEVEGYEGFSVEVRDAQQDQLKQNEQVKELLELGCDVICVNLVDRTAPKKIIDMAKQADVPIIFFNRELVEEDLLTWTKLYYVGARAKESGQFEGEIAVEACKQEGVDKNNDGVIQYVMLEGEAGHQDTTVRTDVSISTMEGEGIALERLTAALANWNRQEAQTKMNQFLQEFGDSIELVISNNDDMALGAIDALETSGIDEKDWPEIVGIDGTRVGLQAVKEGKMFGTVYNDFEGQALAMAKLASSLAQGLSLSSFQMEGEKYIFLPYKKVTQENVDDYLED
jgi:methyl-galactoside transport system substrate-binding protein